MAVVMALLGVGIVFGTMSQRLSGMGFALLMAPLFVIAFGAYEGILLINIGGAFSSFLMLIRVWRFVDWQKFWVLLGTSVPGAGVGAVIATRMEGALLQVLVGILLITGLVTLTLARRPKQELHSRSGAVLAGLASGFTNGTAGFGSPAIAIYAQYTRWNQQSFAATLQPLFIVMSVAALILKTLLSGQPPALDWWVYTGMFVLIVVGSFLGERAGKYLREEWIQRLVIALCYTGAITATLDGLAQLVQA